MMRMLDENCQIKNIVVITDIFFLWAFWCENGSNFSKA